MTDRAFGLPRTRGPLKVWRDCPDCKGYGCQQLPFSPLSKKTVSTLCPTCEGAGRVLYEITPGDATKHARKVVQRTQGKGKLGRDM